MTTIITPVPITTHIPTCPDCRQELPDYDAEYCGTCKQEIYPPSEESWGEIFGILGAIVAVLLILCLIGFPIMSWIANDTTLVAEYVDMFKAIFTKLKTIW